MLAWSRFCANVYFVAKQTALCAFSGRIYIRPLLPYLFSVRPTGNCSTLTVFIQLHFDDLYISSQSGPTEVVGIYTMEPTT